MTRIWNKCTNFASKLHIIMYTNSKKTMKKQLQVLFLVLSAMVSLASCLSTSEDMSVSNTCFISGVSVTSFRRVETCKAADGVTDSTYHSTFSGSNWFFTINQKNLLVENRDSLPHNTDLSRVVLNLTYVGARAYYRASDAWEDEQWMVYNTTDSIDIRQPLHIRVVATDNTERQYTLRMNVHTSHGDSLRWALVEGHEAINGEAPMKATAWEDKVGVLVNDGDAVAWMTHAENNLDGWNKAITDLPVNADVQSLVKSNEALYVNTEDGVLYSSADGIAWTKLCQEDGLRLAGISDDKLYAIFLGALWSTPMNTIEWSAEPLDDSVTLLPDQEIVSLSYLQNPSLTRMILLGNRSVATDTTAVVWTKSWTEFENEKTESWMHYTRSDDNSRQLPMFKQMSLMYYDNMLMAAVGESCDGSVGAMERFYVSNDNGLTWSRLQTILPPSEVRLAEGYIASTVDSDSYIWLFAGGKVYRGRLNRLGYVRPDVY